MTDANTYQVGGAHYKTKYEHWDMVVRTGMGYLEGQCTKYLTRWQKKNGLEDLRKAEHYAQKLIEVAEYAAIARGHLGEAQVRSELAKFFEINNTPRAEQGIFILLATWVTSFQLADALRLIRARIEDLLSAKPVPAEDSNKHGERA